MEHITELFCLVDDFYKEFEVELRKQLLAEGERKRNRACMISVSELMTLVVLFHQVRYRQFKFFYLNHVCRFMRHDFPNLPSYQRCIELMPRCLVALTALFETLKGQCTGLTIVDSTPLAVCDNLRIRRHRVFKAVAGRGKSSTGWFYGFKLHAAINHRGELIAIRITPGNVDDRKPVPEMMRRMFGKLYADKGYISKELTKKLQEMQIEMVTKIKRCMKPVNTSDFDKHILNHRSLIETVFDELKNLCQIEHTRHRSIANCMVSLMAGLVAYCLMPNKPALKAKTTFLSPN